MNRTSVLIAAASLSLALFSSCEVMVNGTDFDDDDDRPTTTTTTTPTTQPQRISFKTASLFPFRDNQNWWQYSEPGGNSLRIAVTDTISDDNILYYRVSFQELRVDTTDDWFQQTSRGTLFGPSLIGTYHQFLPVKIDASTDTFTSNGRTVTYTWHESFSCSAGTFGDAVTLEYSSPIIHGFDEITLADSIGIVQLIDYDGRWTVEYTLDSCEVDGTVQRFRE